MPFSQYNIINMRVILIIENNEEKLGYQVVDPKYEWILLFFVLFYYVP